MSLPTPVSIAFSELEKGRRSGMPVWTFYAYAPGLNHVRWIIQNWDGVLSTYSSTANQVEIMIEPRYADDHNMRHDTYDHLVEEVIEHFAGLSEAELKTMAEEYEKEHPLPDLPF